jgi:outer membrane protein assembly factor BamB
VLRNDREPRDRVRRLLPIGGLALALLAAIAYSSSRERGSTPVLRGSSTREFVTTATPQANRAGLRTGEWATYGYDLARTHVAPSSFLLRPPYRRLWAQRLHDWVEFPPSVAYGNVYVGRLDGVLFAFAGATGAPVWSRSFKPYCTFASPTLARGVLYETFLPPPCDHGDRSKRGWTVALDARSGRLLWRYRGAASESAPLLRDGTLYEGSWDHRLYALDVRGRRPRVRWSFSGDAELNSSPAYATGTVYIGSTGGRVYAVAARTGCERWHASGYSTEDFYATPTIAYGRVFIGNTDGTVYAFGAASGHLLWAAHAGTYVYTAAAVWGRTVYVGSYDGNVYAFDAATGATRWKRNLGGSVHGAPTVMAGLVYFSTCGTCGQHGSRYAKLGPRRTFALDARTGRIVWRFPDGHYSPVVADGRRLYLMGDTTLYALVPCRGSRAGFAAGSSSCA